MIMMIVAAMSMYLAPIKYYRQDQMMRTYVD